LSFSLNFIKVDQGFSSRLIVKLR